MLKSTNVALLLCLVCVALSEDDREFSAYALRFKTFLDDSLPNPTTMRVVMESGGMNGFYTTDEIQKSFAHLAQLYPKYVRAEAIGESVEKRPMFAYHLSSNLHSPTVKKSKVLFTGLHHARELLTANMILKIFLETLHSLIHATTHVNFWKFSDLVVVPIINVDSHNLISERFATSGWNSALLVRKNRNKNFCPLTN